MLNREWMRSITKDHWFALFCCFVVSFVFSFCLFVWVFLVLYGFCFSASFFYSFQDNLLGKMRILLPTVMSYPLMYRLLKLPNIFCWWNKCLTVRESARGNITLNFTDFKKGYVLTY